MNGKKAKLLRKSGNSSKKGKRLYQELPHDARSIATKILELRAKNPVQEPEKKLNQIHKTGLNRKFRRLADNEKRRLAAISRAKRRNRKPEVEVISENSNETV